MADLVASRPIEHVLTGDRMQWQDNMLVGVMTLLQLALIVAAARMMRALVAAPKASDTQAQAPTLAAVA